MQISDFSGLAFQRLSGQGEPEVIMVPGCSALRFALWR